MFISPEITLQRMTQKLGPADFCLILPLPFPLNPSPHFLNQFIQNMAIFPIAHRVSFHFFSKKQF